MPPGVRSRTIVFAQWRRAIVALATTWLLSAPLWARADALGGGATARSGASGALAGSALPLVRDDADRFTAGRLVSVVLMLLAGAGALAWARGRQGGPGAGGGRWGEPFRQGWQRWRSIRGASAVRLVQSTRLTPRASVHVLEWDGRELLVGCAEDGITVLGERVSPAPQTEATAPRSADGSVESPAYGRGST